MRILLLFILIFVNGCSSFQKESVSYNVGGQKLVAARGTVLTSPTEMKKLWEKEAYKICPNGFYTRNLVRTKIWYGGYKPYLEGYVDCKVEQKIVKRKQEIPNSNIKPKNISTSGSGFFITKSGHVLTNHHVIGQCKNITVGKNSITQIPARILNVDRNNDLALLQISNSINFLNAKENLIQKLRIEIVPIASNGLLRSEDVRLGENVLVAGYPFGEIFSNTIKVTKGIVSADRGFSNNFNQFQIDAAVQPGNSGGPIYDENGNIIGLVVAQLNKVKFAENTGSMPENVNFGIKSSTIRQFLKLSGLVSKSSSKNYKISTEQLAEIAKRQSLMIICRQ